MSDYCRLGRCVGGPSCDNTTSESVCGTYPGCTWDEAGCRAFGSQSWCNLGDTGVVPGCELLDAATTCAGTVTPCSDYPNDACTGADGCQLVSAPRCDGSTPLDCSNFGYDCPTSVCDFTEAGCSGTTFCSVFNR